MVRHRHPVRGFSCDDGFFDVIGTCVSGSGFEEILFQSGLCGSGSISGLISVKYYNRCWVMHEAFSEALHRLCRERFIVETPTAIETSAKDKIVEVNVKEFIEKDEVLQFVETYQNQINRCLQGEFGKTPQFWSQYISLVDRQYFF